MTENYEDRWAGHLQRWNIENPGFDYDAMKRRVMTCLHLVLRKYSYDLVKDVCLEFDVLSGLPLHRPPETYYDRNLVVDFPDTQLAGAILRDSGPTWITTLQRFFWALETVRERGDPRNPYDRISCGLYLMAEAIRAVEKALAVSIGAPIAMKVEGKSVVLYPRGAKLLDESLVNDNMTWLVQHPEAKTHFEKALGLYLNGEKRQYRNLLDELRKAMEELLRGVLGNSRPLEKQIEPLGQWLKDKGIHIQVRNMYTTHLKHFTGYQNDAVKHGDDWNESEVEYMIYLTGTFMRMLLVLNEDNHRVD